MSTIKEFRKRNKISQVALSEYLSVTQGFISQMEKEISAIPGWIISKILENPYNWDVSMLEDRRDENPVEEKPSQDMTVTALLGLLAEKDKDIRTLIEMLKKKDEQIDELRKELDARKRETAPSVVHSSAADAV